ncbi:coiled-coil domain-containing protein [Streptosporangium saharense]|uniref:coiled-coil domain-containing protein n=1 Tax=Streptosporangium saharense TaxID=1706840 RepID=UPI0036B73B27
MTALSPTTSPKTSPASRAFRHRTAAACLASALTFGLVLGTAGTAGAAPKPSESQLRAELAQLNKKIDRLIETYAAKRESLKKAQEAEKDAKADLREAEEAYAEAGRQVASIVQVRYQNGPLDLPSILSAPSVGGAAVMEQLTAQQSAQLQNFARSRDLMKQAADRAAQLSRRIGQEAKDVQVQREDAEKVIRVIEDKLQQLVPTGSGRLADGSWAPQLPAGADNITDRTRIMREAVERAFKLPHEVGCYRAENDGGEHPLGRACDFMMSTGGSVPTAENVKLGDEIAAWALENKSRLGVKYVIWRQRINTGSGWRAMSDRGGVTANHYDHVHISMY